MGGIRQRLQLRYSGGTPGDASEPLTNFLDVSTMLEEPLLKILIQKIDGFVTIELHIISGSAVKFYVH